MKHTFSPDRTQLIIIANHDEREILKRMDRRDIVTDDAMIEFLNPMMCDSELHWIPEGATRDLASAPMLGILSQEQPESVPGLAVPNFGSIPIGPGMKAFILERWAFMDYAVRSPLEDLRDKGRAVFVS